MKKNLNLNWIRTFEAAARLSGFSVAGKELGLTQVAVSKQIKALETQLGSDLFIRRPKKIELTAMGKAYLPLVQETLQTLAVSTYGLFGPDQNSTIVVRTSAAMIVWLAPKLREFQLRHPATSFRLVTAVWADIVDTQNIDVDIVLAPNAGSPGFSEKLCEEYIVPICSCSNAKHIVEIGDLQNMNPIHLVGSVDYWSRYMAAYGLEYDVGSARLSVDSFVAACELVSTDSGVAVVIERFAKNAIEKGTSIVIVGDRVPLGQSHFLDSSESAKAPLLAVETFKEWLREIFIE